MHDLSPFFSPCDVLALFRCDPVEPNPIQDGMRSVVVYVQVTKQGLPLPPNLVLPK
jgi:hypothetical protein